MDERNIKQIPVHGLTVGGLFFFVLNAPGVLLRGFLFFMYCITAQRLTPEL
jgi:hypothetical protein